MDEILKRTIAEERLDIIMRIMQNETFSMNQSSAIVGGEARLKQLIAESKISVTKPGRKWFCNAADVLRYAKIRNKSNQTNKKNEKVNECISQK